MVAACSFEITAEELRKVVTYDKETGHFSPLTGRPGWRIGQPLGHVESNGYRRIMIGGVRYLAHRLAWLYVTGEWPLVTVDHRNMKRCDNAWENLRLATHSQNHGNTRAVRNSRSGLKGAHWEEGYQNWSSRIKINGRSLFLGRFENPEDAHRAYVSAAKELFGEFARNS